MLKTGIVICSRMDSVRVPHKPFVHINGVPVLEHLITRLLPSNLPIILAVPHSDYPIYKAFCERFPHGRVKLMFGSDKDPLARMNSVAKRLELDTLVRICHDKIFVDPATIEWCLDVFHQSNLDYVYSSHFVDGSGFEILSAQALDRACQKFQNVEHVGYAIQCVTKKIANLSPPMSQRYPSHRLLIDYPEDVKMMEIVLSTLGNQCTLREVLDWLDVNDWVTQINRLPLLTIYTCAYNAEKYVNEAMGSVAKQKSFYHFEYILVDDFSSDKTPFLMSKFCSIYKNSSWIRNPSNLGLASSSNVALSRARGKYMIRLDADDYFVEDTVLVDMANAMESSGYDIMYPDNHFGSLHRIQKGHEHHHVGGAMFRTRAANHVKFTEGLRGYEGYDFFERARHQLKIGYYEQPIFFYRQHPESMSVNNLEERQRIKEQIDQSLGVRA
jgi:spore coat polysaccharide biosynthesis protein SpsF (cytidylyltransferase family)